MNACSSKLLSLNEYPILSSNVSKFFVILFLSFRFCCGVSLFLLFAAYGSILFLRGEFCDRFRDKRHDVLVEIEGERVGYCKPLRVVESSFLFERDVDEFGFRQEVRDMLALLAEFRIRRDVLVLAEALLKCDVETELFLDLADGSLLHVFAFLDAPLRERPVSKDIVDQRQVDGASLFGVDDGSAQKLALHLCVRDFLALFLADLVFSGFAQFLVHGAQDTVHEFAALLPAERLRKFDRFVDGDFCRHLFAVREQKLIEPDAKYIAVDRRDTVYRRVGSRFLDDKIKIFLLSDDAGQQAFHKRKIAHARSEFIRISLECKKGLRFASACEIPLEERLQYDRSRKVSVIHYSLCQSSHHRHACLPHLSADRQRQVRKTLLRGSCFRRSGFSLLLPLCRGFRALFQHDFSHIKDEPPAIFTAGGTHLMTDVLAPAFRARREPHTRKGVVAPAIAGMGTG